ncbi:MAG TPA: S41 family peptidase [Bryobacteraceae bacterium]|nr:S41 family peptidase [Bryobacteraceae bacterium]
MSIRLAQPMLRAIAVVALLKPVCGQLQTAVTESTSLEAAQKRQAIAEVAKLLRTRYAVASTAEKAATLLERQLAAGAYDSISTAGPFARAIAADLRKITGDRHLDFGVVTPPDTAAPTPDAQRSARLAVIRRGNYGLPRAEILPGNVGYLEVRRFQSPDLGGDTIAAAMQFLANADALIIDLRNCHGGSPYAMPIFAGYLVASPVHLFDMEFRGDNYTDHYWTSAWLPGKRLAGVPLYILTSPYTFSGAEALAYRFQILKRATIIGETTAGGANAGGLLNVAPFFCIWMPMGRPIDPDTSGNWEGTGVIPDIKTAARDALDIAHAEALKALRAKARTEGEKRSVDWALDRAAARLNPPTLRQQDYDRLAGSYGEGRVWFEGGQLRFQRGTDTPYLLTAISATVFTTDTDEPIRLEFGERDVLIFSDEDGVLHRLRRYR